jgi:hypothetical protein
VEEGKKGELKQGIIGRQSQVVTYITSTCFAVLPTTRTRRPLPTAVN